MNKHEFVNENGDLLESTVETAEGGSFRVTIGEKIFQLQPTGDNTFAVSINGNRSIAAAVRDRDGVIYVDIDSHLFELREPSEDGFAGDAGAHGGEKDKIFAPMPGKIVKIQVSVGDAVSEKQAMIVVEAMKMENQVVAKAAGTVKTINFAEGDQVDTETPIIILDLNEA